MSGLLLGVVPRRSVRLVHNAPHSVGILSTSTPSRGACFDLLALRSRQAVAFRAEVGSAVRTFVCVAPRRSGSSAHWVFSEI